MSESCMVTVNASGLNIYSKSIVCWNTFNYKIVLLSKTLVFVIQFEYPTHN